MPEAYAHDGDASSVTQWDFQIRNRDGGSTLLSCRVRVANFNSEVPALNRRELGANPKHLTILADVAQQQQQ